MTPDCNNSKHGEFNSMDRLSDLPDFVIHHIISYLDTEEAYRTSVLSKRWNQIFATKPILDFYHCKFSNETASRDLEYIDTRMQNYSKENLRITEFTLALPATTDLVLACKVDEWLETAVQNQVTEIFLRGPPNYKLPRFLFCAKSLRDLDCHNVEIPFYEAVDLVSLKSLILGDVVVEERMLFHIVSSCLNLKELVLSGCSGFKNIVIPRHSKLEDLYIDGEVPVDGRIILETSSLRYFQYNTNGVNPWPIISNPDLLRNLRHLSVTDVSITDEALAELLPELASLEKLVFTGCPMLTSIKISHTKLKQISLHSCYTLLSIVIDAPCFKKFKFDGQINPSLSITIRSPANCNIHIHTYAWYFKTDAFFKLKKLLKGLNSCNVLKILLIDGSSQSYGDGDGDGDGDGEGEGEGEGEDEDEDEDEDDIEFDEEESGNAELGAPCDIGELKLNLYSYWELSSSSLSAFLNGLFWTCHPPIISLRVDSGYRKFAVEPLLNNLVDMVKCLEHPLKRIEVEETSNGPEFLDVHLKLCW